MLYSQKAPHTSPWRASYGVSFVDIFDKIDRVITASHCIWVTQPTWVNISAWMRNYIPQNTIFIHPCLLSINPLLPSDVIGHQRFWSMLVQVDCSLMAPSHYLITWTNVDLSSMRSNGFIPGWYLLEYSLISIPILCLTYTFEITAPSPGAQWVTVNPLI